MQLFILGNKIQRTLESLKDLLILWFLLDAFALPAFTENSSKMLED